VGVCAGNKPVSSPRIGSWGALLLYATVFASAHFCRWQHRPGCVALTFQAHPRGGQTSFLLALGRVRLGGEAGARAGIEGAEQGARCLLAPVRVSDAVSLAHEWVASSEVPAAAFLWRLSAQCVVCLVCGAQQKGKQQKGKAKA
jgi:hypothetical protein